MNDKDVIQQYWDEEDYLPWQYLEKLLGIKHRQVQNLAKDFEICHAYQPKNRGKVSMAVYQIAGVRRLCNHRKIDWPSTEELSKFVINKIEVSERKFTNSIQKSAGEKDASVTSFHEHFLALALPEIRTSIENINLERTLDLKAYFAQIDDRLKTHIQQISDRLDSSKDAPKPSRLMKVSIGVVVTGIFALLSLSLINGSDLSASIREQTQSHSLDLERQAEAHFDRMESMTTRLRDLEVAQAHTIQKIKGERDQARMIAEKTYLPFYQLSPNFPWDKESN